MRYLIAGAIVITAILSRRAVKAEKRGETKNKDNMMTEKTIKTDREWKTLLTREQYCITRQKGTEPAFTGKYYDFKEKGIYRCVACGNPLFGWDTKYDSGSGWPSYWQPIGDQAVTERADSSYGLVRTEVVCSRCEAHLGHVFADGPQPTGRRYCINSAALEFEKQEGTGQDSEN